MDVVVLVQVERDAAGRILNVDRHFEGVGAPRAAGPVHDLAAADAEPAEGRVARDVRRAEPAEASENLVARGKAAPVVAHGKAGLVDGDVDFVRAGVDRVHDELGDGLFDSGSLFADQRSDDCRIDGEGDAFGGPAGFGCVFVGRQACGCGVEVQRAVLAVRETKYVNRRVKRETGGCFSVTDFYGGAPSQTE